MGTSNETEVCFYALIGNREGLKRAATVEIQEQYSFIVPSEIEGKVTKIRTRACTKDGQTRYELTIKAAASGEQDKCNAAVETTALIGEKFFETWKATVSPEGIRKVRYVFVPEKTVVSFQGTDHEIPGVKYEVDVFISKDGSESKWCKIDIELDVIFDYMKAKELSPDSYDLKVAISKLPFEPQHTFSGDTENEEEKAAVQNFWKSFTY